MYILFFSISILIIGIIFLIIGIKKSNQKIEKLIEERRE